MTNTLIHSHSSLENHTPFQTKLGKIYTLFQAETVQLKIIPFGAAHIYVRKYSLVCVNAFFSKFSPAGKKISTANQTKSIHISSQMLPSHPSLAHSLLVPTI